MARALNLFTNFTAGQIDEILEGRVDLSKYNNAAKKVRNFIPFQQGGVKGRPGTRFVAEAKFSNKKCLLLPFSFSTDQSYVLEFGDQYVRFFTNSGRLESPPGTPIEVATPYLEADLELLKFTQSADIMYITHPDYPVKQLNRTSGTVWTLTDFKGNPPATVEPDDIDYNVTLTLGATSGNGVTATAGANCFLQADIGRQIRSGGGLATIVGFTSQTVVTVDILQTFSETNIAAGAWFLMGSPNVGLTASAAGPVNSIQTFTTAGATNAFKTVSPSDLGKYIIMANGVARITQIISATQVKGIILVPLDNVTPVVAGNWTLEVDAWSSTRGFPRTAGFYDQRLMFAGTDSEPDTIWGSGTGRFNVLRGGTDDAEPVRYVLAANQVNVIEWISPQRDLIVGTSGSEFKVTGGTGEPLTPANVLAKPETSWGSESLMPVRADRATIFVERGWHKLRAISFNFDIDGYEAIDLMLLATNIGSPGILQIGFEKTPVPIIWSVRADGMLLSLTFDPKQEVYAWAEHSTDGLFESVCPILHQGDHTPGNEKYQTWVVVNRTIGGTTKRYIEFFDQSASIANNHPINVDSGLSYNGTITAATLTPGATSGASVTFTASASVFAAGDVGQQLVDLTSNGRAEIIGFTSDTVVTAKITSDFPNTNPIPAGSWGLGVKTVSGLSHLEGKTVQIVGDGAVYPPKVVSSGTVTLDGAHSLKIDVGLLFVPELVTLRPAINIGPGNSVFITKGYSKVFVLFYKTLGAKINDQQVEFRSSAEPMGVAPSIKSEIFEVSSLGYDRNAHITIKQEQPLPITITAVAGMLEVGDE